MKAIRTLLTTKGALLALILLSCPLYSLADDWSLKSNDGVRYKLADQQGKWVLVNFWAPWCPFCITEMPELNTLQLKHKNVLVLGIAVMYRNKKEVLDIVKAQSVAYPIIMGNEDIASDFGEMKGMPTSFLYSPSGKLIGHHDGPLTLHEIEQVMAQKPESAGLFIQ